jgi:hypothetical protein
MMVFLVVALGLVLLYAILKPLGDGLFDTSAWAAKTFAPQGIEENENSKLFIRRYQK